MNVYDQCMTDTPIFLQEQIENLIVEMTKDISSQEDKFNIQVSFAVWETNPEDSSLEAANFPHLNSCNA